MREIEDRCVRMVEESGQGVWFVGADLVITYVNRSMADMLGYTREEMLGHPALDFVAESCRDQISLPPPCPVCRFNYHRSAADIFGHYGDIVGVWAKLSSDERGVTVTDDRRGIISAAGEKSGGVVRDGLSSRFGAL